MTIESYDNFSRHLEMTGYTKPNYLPFIIAGVLTVAIIVLVVSKSSPEKDKDKAIEG